MASISRVEINVANNAELRANAQSILALTRAESVTNLINGLVDLILVELADQRGAARQTFGPRDER